MYGFLVSSTKNRLFCLIAGLALLAWTAAFVGLGMSYRDFATPTSGSGQYRRISGDGWVSNGAEIVLERLAGRGNRLVLSFDPWRPEGAGPARMRVSVCGRVAAEFQVSRQQREHLIYLTGSCDPRVVSFNVLNPLKGLGSDERLLGAKLVSSRVVSAAGIPIVQFPLLFRIAGAVFVLLLAGFVLLRRLGSSMFFSACACILLALAATGLLGKAGGLQLRQAYMLWLLFGSLFAGMLFAGKGTESGPGSSGQRPPLPGLRWPGWLPMIVLLGAALRLWGLDFGLPNNYHPDEVPKINSIMRMVEAGNLNPQYFLHPSLLLYSTYFVNTILHWLGMSGEFRDTAFFAGRLVSALAGTVSIYLVYLIGRRLFSPEAGMLGAAILAVLPLHVTCSRYMKEDVLLLCMCLGCLAALLKAAQETRPDFMLLSGFLAGVAASSKYSGLLMVAAISGAPWLKSGGLRPDKAFIRHTIFALMMLPVGFIACTPYSIIALEDFLKGVGSEGNHMLRGHTIPVDPWSQYWTYHLWRSILPGMSLVGTLVGIAGCGVMLWRARMKDLFLVALILLFYLPAEWVKAKPEPQPERYILPCLPFLALAAAEFVCFIRKTSLGRIAPVAALILFLVPTVRTVELASEIKYDTRSEMADWMINNLPAGAKVYLDWKPYSPRFWHGEFAVSHIPRAKILVQLDVDALRNSGFDYLVLSSLFYERYFSQPLADPALRQRLRDVFERVPVVHEIKPRYGTYGFNNPTLTLFSLKSADFAELEKELALKRAGEISETSNDKKASFKWAGK